MEGIQDIINYTLIVVCLEIFTTILFVVGFLFARHFRK